MTPESLTLLTFLLHCVVFFGLQMKQAHCIVGRGAARRQLGMHTCLRLYVAAVFLAFPVNIHVFLLALPVGGAWPDECAYYGTGRVGL